MSAGEEAYFASLRPSRIREVQAGRLGWTTVDVLDVGTGDGPRLRAPLEAFGAHVNLWTAGTARHVAAALGGAMDAPYLVLSCHGEDGGLLMPDLGEELAAMQPFGRRLDPGGLRATARIAGSTVVCTGCETGTPELAEAFLAAGAVAYLAPQGAPFGYAGVFATLFVFYELTQQRTLADAVARLRAHDDELAMWRLWPS